MNTYRITLIFIFLTCIYMPVDAQKYRTAAGIRFQQDNFGITLQQKLFKNTTLEGIGAFGGDEVSVTGLIEKHFPVIGPGFNLYFGGGGHVGALKDRGAFFGGDLIVGTELKVPILPLVLALDLKPAFHVNHDDWGSVNGGFSMRYILVKDKKEKKKLFGIFERREDNDNRSRRKKKQEPEKKKGLKGILEGLKKEQ